MSDGFGADLTENITLSDIELSVGDADEVRTAEDIEGEDLLLAEIDAFRNKAAQLQQLITAKEGKAAELEALVKEKEAVNQELQDELYKKREEADAIVTDVECQVERMLKGLRDSMDKIELDITTLVNNNNEAVRGHVNELYATVDELKRGLDAVGNDISEKTHSESVHLYRMMQDEIKEHDNSEALAAKANTHFKSLKGFAIGIMVITVKNLLN